MRYIRKDDCRKMVDLLDALKVNFKKRNEDMVTYYINHLEHELKTNIAVMYPKNDWNIPEIED